MRMRFGLAVVLLLAFPLASALADVSAMREIEIHAEEYRIGEVAHRAHCDALGLLEQRRAAADAMYVQYSARFDQLVASRRAIDDWWASYNPRDMGIINTTFGDEVLGPDWMHLQELAHEAFRRESARYFDELEVLAGDRAHRVESLRRAALRRRMLGRDRRLIWQQGICGLDLIDAVGARDPDPRRGNEDVRRLLDEYEASMHAALVHLDDMSPVILDHAGRSLWRLMRLSSEVRAEVSIRPLAERLGKLVEANERIAEINRETVERLRGVTDAEQMAALEATIDHRLHRELYGPDDALILRRMQRILDADRIAAPDRRQIRTLRDQLLEAHRAAARRLDAKDDPELADSSAADRWEQWLERWLAGERPAPFEWVLQSGARLDGGQGRAARAAEQRERLASQRRAAAAFMSELEADEDEGDDS